MFSKMARRMLRGSRVSSKQELIDRIHLYFQHINADPRDAATGNIHFLDPVLG